jgi:putative drug exporter of the RND superfamily
MFAHIGSVVTRRPRLILLFALAAVIVSAALGIHAPGRLRGGGFTSPDAPSQIAADRLESRFGGSPNLLFVVQARTGAGTVDSPAVAAAATQLARQLAHATGVSAESDYWVGHNPALRSRDGREALIVADLAGKDTQVQDEAKGLIARFSVPAGRPGSITVVAGGFAAVNHAVSAQIAKDLAVAEGIAIPLTALLLIIAFGSAVAALLPVAIGVTSIFFTLFVLWVLSGVTNVSIYAINLTTAMGLGLGIDYSLLIVNRYREELANGRPPTDAVIIAIHTAGRTVTFSAATVAAALAALLLFPVYFLRSFAYAGISVVAIATVSAVVVLPALLTILGPRVNAGRVGFLAKRPAGGGESPFWRSVATRVMARPVVTALPVVVLLLALGAPFLHVKFGTPDDRVLPTSSAAREAGDDLRTKFGVNTSNTIDVVTARPLGPAAAADYSRTLSQLTGVTMVKGPAGVWSNGSVILPPGPATVRYQAPGGSWFDATIAPDPLSGAAAGLVHHVRAIPPPGGVTAYVGGQAAGLVDQKHDLGSRLPLAIGLIALTTFIILFLFTGSVVLPLKALVLNALSLTAVFGAVVWVFQDGHLRGLLGFTPMPTSTTMPLLLFCIAFGLSMDYEVFLLSRIKELHEAGAGTEEAVSGGLARTGRIVTTAAALLAVTFVAFGLSKVSFIQMFGLGTALAILVDASLVRGVLVPSFMRLAGDANWWAPPPLRRIYRRIGLSEAPVGAA